MELTRYVVLNPRWRRHGEQSGGLAMEQLPRKRRASRMA